MASELIDSINEVAERYFALPKGNRNKNDEMILWSKLFRLEENAMKYKNRYHSEMVDFWVCDDDDVKSVHWETALDNELFKIGSITVTHDVFQSAIIEALGYKTLADGSASEAGYSLDNSCKFTTYFYNLLKFRSRTSYEKTKNKNIHECSFDATFDQDDDDDSSLYDFVSDNTSDDEIIKMEIDRKIYLLADYFGNVIKSKKGLSLAGLYYSLLLINYFRDDRFYNSIIEDYYKKIIFPLDFGYTEKMTTVPNGKPMKIRDLYAVPFSSFVYENLLYKTSNGVDELENKSIAVYAGVTAGTVSKQITKMKEVLTDKNGEYYLKV